MLDKNRPIVFLSATTVMENTIERFAIHQLPELGYQVTIVDLSKIVDARVFGGVSISEWNVENIRRECYDHILQFDTFVAAHPDSYYFLLFDYYYEVRKIYDVLTKYNVDYGNASTALTDNGFIPQADGNDRWKNYLQRFSPNRWKRIFFNRVVRRSGKHKPANFQLIGGWNQMEDLWHNCCTQEGVTKRIHVRSFDYERFLHADGYDNGGKPYIVFLDQGLPFHPDLKMSHSEIPADKYFEEMHDIFDVIRNRYGIEIIIAAHPRVNYADKGDVWKGCKVVYGQSPQLVKNATLAMTHTSGSIAFAMMAEKPALILLPPQVEKGYYHRQICDYWSKLLDAPIIRRGADLHDTMDYVVNEEAYKKANYLYTESCDGDTRSFWEIATSEME